MVIDTGATCNILCESDYNKLKVCSKLEKCRSKVSGYGNDSAILILGECQLETKFQKKTMCRRFVIAAGNTGSILGYEACVNLGLVNVTVNKISCEPEDIFEEYRDIFEGIGKLKNVKVNSISMRMSSPWHRNTSDNHSISGRRLEKRLKKWKNMI